MSVESNTQHRDFTCSSTEQQESQDGRHHNQRAPSPHSAHQPAKKPMNTPRHKSPPLSGDARLGEIDADAQDVLDVMQWDAMMDQVFHSASNPVRAPFPSPALKTTQPVYPFPCQASSMSHCEGGWSHLEASWHQGGTCTKSILVEAANRAQMAILLDEMGSLGIEQVEQT